MQRVFSLLLILCLFFSFSLATATLLSTQRAARTADAKDYRIAQNAATQALYYLNNAVFNYALTNATLEHQVLVAQFSNLVSSNAVARLTFPGLPTPLVSAQGVDGVAALAEAASTGGRGEIHNFGAIQTQQIAPSDARFCSPYGCEADANSGVYIPGLVDSRPVTLVLRSVGSTVAKQLTGPGFTGYRAEYVWVVRVRGCTVGSSSLLSSDGTVKRQALIVSIDINILATVDFPSDYPVNYVPISLAQAYVNPAC